MGVINQRSTPSGRVKTSIDKQLDFVIRDVSDVIRNISGITPEKIVFIGDASDFPESENGVITLKEDVTYFITGHIDINGDRLVGSYNTTIIGASSENCTITSTGLGVGIPLFTTEWTTPIRHISFTDVDTAISVNGSANPPVALDWTGVNFVNIPTIGNVNTCDNFIYSKGAFINSKGIRFTGTIGTIGIDNSLLSGDGDTGSLIEIDDSCIVTRRFRVIYSSFVVYDSTIGIDVNGSATIPVDSYILDTCNFSGGGTYIQGIGLLFTDNETRFINNKGITNTAPFGNMYFSSNATPTVISTVGTPTKILGSTTASSINQKFQMIDELGDPLSNRLRYLGALKGDYIVTAICSFTATGANKKFGLYITKNGVVLDDSEMYATTDGNNRAESIAVQCVVDINTDDYIEVWIENATDDTDVTVQYMNCIVRRLQ